MYLRFLLLGLVLSGLVGWSEGCFPPLLVVETAPWPLALLAAAVLGSLPVRWMGASGQLGWQKFFLLLLGAVWLTVTGLSLSRQWESLAGFGPLAWKLARPYAVSSSLFFGYLALCYGAFDNRRTILLPVTLLAPVAMALLLLGNPAAAGMFWLPLLAAAGLVPRWQSEVTGEGVLSSWQEGGAVVLEMVSLQTVAWGAVLSLLGLLMELPANGLLSAVFVAFGTGFSAWILSGLLWGAAESLRLRRFSVERPVRWLFGHQAVAAKPAGGE